MSCSVTRKICHMISSSIRTYFDYTLTMNTSPANSSKDLRSSLSRALLAKLNTVCNWLTSNCDDCWLEEPSGMYADWLFRFTWLKQDPNLEKKWWVSFFRSWIEPDCRLWNEEPLTWDVAILARDRRSAPESWLDRPPVHVTLFDIWVEKDVVSSFCWGGFAGLIGFFIMDPVLWARLLLELKHASAAPDPCEMSYAGGGGGAGNNLRKSQSCGVWLTLPIARAAPITIGKVDRHNDTTCKTMLGLSYRSVA